MTVDRNKDQLLPSEKIQVQDITAKRVLRLLPNQTFNSSLGNYTQLVHLACPHWFDFSIDLVRPDKKRRLQLFSDHNRLPAVDCDLRDYTQWVHSACPHWPRFYSTRPV